MNKQEAIEWLEQIKDIYIRGGDEDFDRRRKEALDLAIEALQTDIVRCKDCRHAEHREQMPNQVYCKRDKLSLSCALHDDDDFCKYGERRE